MNGEPDMKQSGSPGKPVAPLRQMPWGLVGLLMAYSFVSWLNRVSMSAAGTEKIIPETVDAMRAFNLKTIAAGHCTGWRAIGALASAFGHAVVPSAVGETFRL